jgi:hypothetical protein
MPRPLNWTNATARWSLEFPMVCPADEIAPILAHRSQQKELCAAVPVAVAGPWLDNGWAAKWPMQLQRSGKQDRSVHQCFMLTSPSGLHVSSAWYCMVLHVSSAWYCIVLHVSSAWYCIVLHVSSAWYCIVLHVSSAWYCIERRCTKWQSWPWTQVLESGRSRSNFSHAWERARQHLLHPQSSICNAALVDVTLVDAALVDVTLVEAAVITDAPMYGRHLKCTLPLDRVGQPHNRGPQCVCSTPVAAPL